jgi:pimeloyl-ACP methyl ester carboxylesterase
MSKKTVALTGAAALTLGLIAWELRPDSPRPVIATLEHTARHRGGLGSPLLLLHGVSCTWRVWSPVLQYLEPHHDVLAPTLLGHAGAGEFDPDMPLSLATLVDDIEEQLDRAGLDALHIVGNSLGGWLAIELARRGRAKSLVLLSPGGACRPAWRLRATATAIRIAAIGLARCSAHADFIASRRALRTLVLCTQVADVGRVSPDYVSASLRAFALAPMIGELLRAVGREQVAPLPPGQGYPIRLVWPHHDRVLPFKAFGMPMLQRIPDAELVRIADAGHVPMSDDPAMVAKLILEVTSAVDAGEAAAGQKGR